jgi:hypothetical protein
MRLVCRFRTLRLSGKSTIRCLFNPLAAGHLALCLLPFHLVSEIAVNRTPNQDHQST